jgi:hypothetical protein
LAAGDEFLPRGKTLSVIKIVVVGKALAADWVGFGNPDEAHFVGMRQSIGGVGARTALTSTDEDEFKWTRHANETPANCEW